MRWIIGKERVISSIYINDDGSLLRSAITNTYNRFLYIQANISNYDEAEAALLQSSTADNLRPALLDVISTADKASHSVILIIDKHAFLRCDFRESLKALLSVPRCGNHLFTQDSGGALVLGISPTDIKYCGAQAATAGEALARALIHSEYIYIYIHT